tara:strand:+ start:698 stop:901 length:204 start_codon:yes stop_codon:yes gene_type:complete
MIKTKNIMINKTILKTDKGTYKGYLLGDLPPSFGYKFKEELNEKNEVIQIKGLNKWFNRKGLTWIKI